MTDPSQPDQLSPLPGQAGRPPGQARLPEAGRALARSFPGGAAGCLGILVAFLAAGVCGGVWLFALSGSNDPVPGTDTYVPPTDQAAPGATGPEGWTVSTPEEAAGLTLAFSGGPELPHREAALNQAGLGVRDLVGGRYLAPDDPAVGLDFHGGRLTQPLSGPQVDAAARTMLDTAFRVGFPNLTATGPSNRYDAGERGGQVWCASYDTGGASCGWVDGETLGVAFSIGLAEPELAALLVDARADLETRG